MHYDNIVQKYTIFCLPYNALTQESIPIEKNSAICFKTLYGSIDMHHKILET